MYSNHHSLLLTRKARLYKGRGGSRFRVEINLLKWQDFKELVEKVWQDHHEDPRKTVSMFTNKTTRWKESVKKGCSQEKETMLILAKKDSKYSSTLPFLTT